MVCVHSQGLAKHKEASVLSSAERQQPPQNLKTISNPRALKNQALKDEQSQVAKLQKANCQEIRIKVSGLL